MDKNSNSVEILCISTCKTLCISLVKLCALLHLSPTPCVKIQFPTKFYNFSNRLFHRSLTPVSKQTFPLFHTPYYYYYNFLNNINNNYRKDIL